LTVLLIYTNAILYKSLFTNGTHRDIIIQKHYYNKSRQKEDAVNWAAQLCVQGQVFYL